MVVSAWLPGIARLEVCDACAHEPCAPPRGAVQYSAGKPWEEDLLFGNHEYEVSGGFYSDLW